MYLLIVTLHCHFLAATSKMQLKHAGHLPSPYATPSQLYILYITCCTYEQNSSHYGKTNLLSLRRERKQGKVKRAFWFFFFLIHFRPTTDRSKKTDVCNTLDLRHMLLCIPNGKNLGFKGHFNPSLCPEIAALGAVVLLLLL